MALPNFVILLVEPHEPTRQLYARELGRFWPVVACDNIQSALEMLDNERISAVILEPALEDGDGWSVLSAVNSQYSSTSMPVIICSALDERKRGIEMGASAYLVKPAPPRELEQTLRRLLEEETKISTST